MTFHLRRDSGLSRYTSIPHSLPACRLIAIIKLSTSPLPVRRLVVPPKVLPCPRESAIATRAYLSCSRSTRNAAMGAMDARNPCTYPCHHLLPSAPARPLDSGPLHPLQPPLGATPPPLCSARGGGLGQA